MFIPLTQNGMLVGHNFATYTSATNALMLHTSPPASLTVPPLTLLFALSAPHSHRVRTLVAVTTTQTILFISASLSGPTPSLALLSETMLPLPSPSKLILPVDPMAWVGQLGSGTRDTSEEHDVLLSVSEDGELAFWVPEGGLTSPTRAMNGNVKVVNGTTKQRAAWKCTGKVRTGRKGFTMARCSSAKKSVLGKCSFGVPRMIANARAVVPLAEGEELTIWDSKESEFSLGLEYRRVLRCASFIYVEDPSSNLYPGQCIRNY